MKILSKAEIVNLLEQKDSINDILGFRHANGLLRKDMNKKINEIAGFCEQILKAVRKHNDKKRRLSFLNVLVVNRTFLLF